MQRGPVHYDYRAVSDVGLVRTNNEDALIEAPDKGLFGVCDGLGGHAAGEIASSIASGTLIELLSDDCESPDLDLKTVIQEANQRILAEQRNNPDQRGMGTTVSSMWLMPGSEPEAWIGHVGDSRVYRLRDSRLEQLTEDHSPVFRLYKQGLMTKEQMRAHPQKNLLDRSLGVVLTIDPDVFAITLSPRDRYLICSDGLTDCVGDEHLEECLALDSLDEAVGKLVQGAKGGGGQDNITIVVLGVNDVEQSGS